MEFNVHFLKIVSCGHCNRSSIFKLTLHQKPEKSFAPSHEQQVRSVRWTVDLMLRRRSAQWLTPNWTDACEPTVFRGGPVFTDSVVTPSELRSWLVGGRRVVRLPPQALFCRRKLHFSAALAAGNMSSLAVPPPQRLLRPLAVPHRHMFGPGPSNVPPRILEAGAKPVIGHMHPEIFEVNSWTGAMGHKYRQVESWMDKQVFKSAQDSCCDELNLHFNDFLPDFKIKCLCLIVHCETAEKPKRSMINFNKPPANCFRSLLF